jgi:CotH kinase protein/Secretion system C-terminal sorting domain
MQKKQLLNFFTCLISCAAFAQIDHYETIISEGQNWQYLVPTAEPAAAWRNLTFGNNPTWTVAPTGIGYGDGDDQTVISQTSSVYLRHEFNISDTAAVKELLFYMDYDDAYVAYLNGTEISRANIGNVGTAPIFTDLATNSLEALFYQGQTPAALRLDKADFYQILNQGNNVLAVQVHNFITTSSDLTAIPILIAGIGNNSNNYQPLPNWFVGPPFAFDTSSFSSNLPLIIINTANNNPIVDAPKTFSQMRIIHNGQGQRNNYTDLPNAYSGSIGIEFRGSSSQSFPKKPYGFETWNGSQTPISVSLLGMPAESDWILAAHYSDKTLFNNVLSYKLFSEFGYYAPRTRFVELVVNGDYQGVYVLMEKIKRDNNRVDIAKLTLADTAGLELTGGYIVKIDKTTGSGGGLGWNSAFAPLVSTQIPSIFVQYAYPNAANILPQQDNYVQQSFYDFENSLANLPLGDTTVDNWRNYAEENTFIYYLILNELSKNVDGYRLSTFLHKDRDDRNPLWKISPPWDYDIAWGNADYCNASDTSGWAYDFGDQCPGDGFQVPFWWGQFEQDSLFVKNLKCKYTYLRAANNPLNTNVLFDYLDETALYLDEAQTRNFNRWPILGTYVWPNPQPVPADYAGEIIELKTWISRRTNWLDMQLLDTSLRCAVDTVATSVLLEEFDKNDVQIFPNPAQNILNIYSPAPIEQIEIYNIMGQIVYNQQVSNQMLQITIYNLNALLPNAGLYSIRIMSQNKQKTLLFFKE